MPDALQFPQTPATRRLERQRIINDTTIRRLSRIL